MVVNRVESAADILRELKSLERRQFEMKERQLVGADSVRVFKIQTDKTWDWSGSLTLGAAIYQRDFTVTFRPNSNNAGLNVAVKDEVVGSNSKTQISIIGLPVTDPQVQQWRVRVQHYTNETIRLKFFVIATGKGTIDVV